MERKPVATLSLSRFEAYTDGVFAIVTTLLFIEIQPFRFASGEPEVSALLHLWPEFLACITSFLVIAVIWLNHHAMFHLARVVDRVALLLNAFLLLGICFIPFSTGMLGKNVASPTACAFYGINLTVVGIFYNLLWFYLLRTRIQGGVTMDEKTIRHTNLWSIGYPVAYAVTSLIAPVAPRLSLILYVAIPLFYLLPGRIDQFLASNAEH